MYIFDGPADAMMLGFFAHLAKATGGGPYTMANLHDAMVDLVGLEVALARDGGTDADALTRFRAGAGTALLDSATLVGGYLYLAADAAEETSEPDWPEWYDFCIRRSAIELIRAWFPAAATTAFDPDDLVRLDRELRRLAPKQEPLPEHLVPRGLPIGHWWWCASPPS